MTYDPTACWMKSLLGKILVVVSSIWGCIKESICNSLKKGKHVWVWKSSFPRDGKPVRAQLLPSRLVGLEAWRPRVPHTLFWHFSLWQERLLFAPSAGRIGLDLTLAFVFPTESNVSSQKTSLKTHYNWLQFQQGWKPGEMKRMAMKWIGKMTYDQKISNKKLVHRRLAWIWKWS